MFERANYLALTTDTRLPEGVGMIDRGLDDPDADVAEQHQEAVPGSEEDEAELPERVPLEADPADAAEQAREVQLGEDDYR
jgi:hypothetical protein